MKVLDNLNLNLNEIRSVKAEVLASDPSTGAGTAGQFWYNSVAGRIKFSNGAAAVVLISAGADFTNGDIPIAKLATDPLARANHTGTQLANTISNFDTQVRTSRLDQMTAPTGPVAFGSQRLTGVATPTSGTDAANKQYVDDAVAGLSWKDEVVAASTANLTLSGAQTIDGVSVIAGDRVLVKNQSTASANGIYLAAAGAWTRAGDADTAADIQGAALFVKGGTVNGGTRWVCNAAGTIVLGTTSLTFIQFDGATSYTAGNGLTLTGADFAVGAGTGITVNANDVAIDTAVVVRKVVATITGDGTTTSFALTHNFGNQFVQVTAWDNLSPYEIMLVSARATDSNTVTVVFPVAPANLVVYKIAIAG